MIASSSLIDYGAVNVVVKWLHGRAQLLPHTLAHTQHPVQPGPPQFLFPSLSGIDVRWGECVQQTTELLLIGWMSTFTRGSLRALLTHMHTKGFSDVVALTSRYSDSGRPVSQPPEESQADVLLHAIPFLQHAQNVLL